MAAVSRILRLGPANMRGHLLFLLLGRRRFANAICARLLTSNSLGPIRVPHHDAGHFARRFVATGLCGPWRRLV